MAARFEIIHTMLGILMLQTRFPRPAGDIGHRATWRMPVIYRTVPGASPARVVQGRAVGLLQPFIDGALALVDEGASAIAISCGFLALFQRELSAAVPVPVWTSSLLKLSELGDRRPGILTVDAQALGAEHLRAVGARTDLPIEGLAAGCSLQRTLLEDRAELDGRQACQDVVAAALRLQQRHPEIDSLVFECTNLPPYSDAVRRATGLVVHDISTVLHERWQRLVST